ncbi:MAG: hypothetical protein KAU95_03895 [Candidatus Aenigmarchaeota archaeon]|nr:hypothetical protein [Candidatus Aenigmarchaeota archaeon]
MSKKAKKINIPIWWILLVFAFILFFKVQPIAMVISALLIVGGDILYKQNKNANMRVVAIAAIVCGIVILLTIVLVLAISMPTHYTTGVTVIEQIS